MASQSISTFHRFYREDNHLCMTDLILKRLEASFCYTHFKELLKLGTCPRYLVSLVEDNPSEAQDLRNGLAGDDFGGMGENEWKKFNWFLCRNHGLKFFIIYGDWSAFAAAKRLNYYICETLYGDAGNVEWYRWSGRKHTCVDLTGVSHLVGFDNGVFMVGQAMPRATKAKMAKHDQVCKDNQHRFIPFAFDTFGFFASDVVEFLMRVHKVMNRNVMTAGLVEYVFRE